MAREASDALPLAKRLVRPGWRDPRLGVGVLLVAGSVALGAWTIDRASATEPVYAARADLVPGHAVTAADLVVVQANTAAPDGAYLAPGTDVDGMVLTSVEAGQLVPAGAVAPQATLDRRPVVVEVGGSLPSSVAVGAVVELWVTAPASGENVPQPLLVADRLEVSEVAADATVLGAGRTTSVELLAPPDVVPDVLAARALGGELVVVPFETAAADQRARDEEPAQGGEPDPAATQQPALVPPAAPAQEG